MQNKLNAKVFPNLPNRRLANKSQCLVSTQSTWSLDAQSSSKFWNEFKWSKSVKLKQLCTISLEIHEQETEEIWNLQIGTNSDKD